jgi:hypothetical protein
MLKTDSDNFQTLIKTAYELASKPEPSLPALRFWWSALENYSYQDVKKAVHAEVGSTSYLITPAGVLKHLTVDNFRLSADEAWAIAVQANDESATVVWTNEIAEAWGVSQTIDDKVGARMAFKSAYERITEQAIKNGVITSWTVTLGSDPEQRKQALETAESKGILTHDRVEKLLPTPDKPLADNVVALLTNKKPVDHDKHINNIRQILSVKK